MVQAVPSARPSTAEVLRAIDDMRRGLLLAAMGSPSLSILAVLLALLSPWIAVTGAVLVTIGLVLYRRGVKALQVAKRAHLGATLMAIGTIPLALTLVAALQYPWIVYGGIYSPVVWILVTSATLVVAGYLAAFMNIARRLHVITGEDLYKWAFYAYISPLILFLLWLIGFYFFGAILTVGHVLLYMALGETKEAIRAGKGLLRPGASVAGWESGPNHGGGGLIGQSSAASLLMASAAAAAILARWSRAGLMGGGRPASRRTSRR